MRRTLALLLLLGGCGSYQVHKARQDILGMSAPDLLACAGVPDKVQQLSDSELMVQYDRPADNGSLLSIKALTMADITLGRSGACHAHFRILRDGTVSGVSFSGTTFSFSGPYGDCASLIKECVEQPDRTQLPAGYDVFSILLREKQKS
jgi:hypothetical protein